MDLGSALLVVAVSAAPIAELRGGIPLALARGFSPAGAYGLAVAANLLAVPLVLFGLNRAEALALRWRPARCALEWLFARTRRRGRLIERVGAAALLLFVAVPLPGTGAWTGAVAARLFGIRSGKAALWIGLGVLVAGVVVLLVSLGLFELFGIG